MFIIMFILLFNKIRLLSTNYTLDIFLRMWETSLNMIDKKKKSVLTDLKLSLDIIMDFGKYLKL